MLSELLGVLMMALHGLGASASPPAEVTSLRDIVSTALPPGVFHTAERAVTNWRQQAALQLDLPPLKVVQTFAGIDPPATSRCVRLNNYWCIKQAGWSGEIAADPEGHVAFATALDGATVAALLLRRYYLTYNKRSALAIISRWAPAQCGVVASPRPSTPSGAAKTHAPKGIRNTLRARFLAGHTRGGRTYASGGPSMRRTIIADRSLSLMPAPEIAVGMGEHLTFVAPRRAAKPGDSAPLTSGSQPGATPVLPTSPCGDTQRVRAYAARAIVGIAPSVDGDLALFSADGAPGPNLARLMRNMAGVEIGPLDVRTSLIAAAIIRAQRLLPPVPAPGNAAPAGG